MSTSDYFLYTALFVAILATQLGTRRPDLKRLILPVAIVGGVGTKYLEHLPTGTWPHLLEVGGVVAGLVFGLASIGFIKVGKDSQDGRVVTQSGWAYAATWLTALALRLGFAYGSTHWFTHALGQFSMTHHIPGATYGTAFVLMVLTMIVVRTAGVLIRGTSAGAHIPPGSLRFARRTTSHAR